MSLEVDVVTERGGFSLRASLRVVPGEVVAVLGPNGAGKTTLLRAVSGLETPREGKVELGGRVLYDRARGIDVPAAEREVGMVFQEYLIFPHLTVGQNVGFGKDAQDAPLWMRRLGLEHLASRRGRDISGGEAQRVALARALANRPAALLLDEPLSALDVERRHNVRHELARHLGGLEIPVLLVTHDPIDAALMADRMVILEAGELTHEGTIAEITRRPRTAWAARLAGVNLYKGEAARGTVDIDGARLVVADEIDGPTFAAVPPHAVSLYREAPAGSPRNVWKGEVVAVEPIGSRFRVAVEGVLPAVAEVTPQAVEALDLGRQGTVWVVVKASEIETYPA
ncbi:MAG: sulfate/molybdate ABC transporter ATP-binding protein [Actinomycetota bacterium]